MISIIIGTNNTGTEATTFADIYKTYFEEKGEEVQVFSLEDLPKDMVHNLMYNPKEMPESLKNIQDKYLISADKWFFIIPEYNGSIPGILKLFIDAVSIRDMKKTFKGKKIGMTGISAGRAGNLRGMDHLTGVMNFLQAIVHPNRLPISVIYTLINKDKSITHQPTLDAMKQQVDEFTAF